MIGTPDTLGITLTLPMVNIPTQVIAIPSSFEARSALR